MNQTDLIKDWRLHAVVFLIVILTESIGIHEFAVGPGVIMLLPMLYAIVIGLGLYFTPIIKKKSADRAEPFIVLGVTLLIAKIGVIIGPSLPEIIEAGPALLLQEFGNLATILIALPIAILLGFKREAIGMTHSIAREPNVGLIMDKYGFNSPEGRGVMAIYIFGTVFGAVFFGLAAGYLATLTPLSHSLLQWHQGRQWKYDGCCKRFFNCSLSRVRRIHRCFCRGQQLIVPINGSVY